MERRLRAHRRVAMAAAASIIITTAAGCQREAAPEEAPRTPSAVQVGPENVAVVARNEISTGPLVSGTLMAEQEATVRAEVGGSLCA